MSVNNPSFIKTNLAQGSANDGLLLALYCPSAKYGFNIFKWFKKSQRIIIFYDVEILWNSNFSVRK